jgi:hypothetical protein
MSYHAQQPVARKYGGVVTTVDPSQSIIQVALKTGDNVSVGSYTTSTIWRWPQVGDEVMVRQENGSWVLEGWFLNTEAAETIQDANPGDAVIMAPTGVVHVIGSTDGGTDFDIAKRVFTKAVLYTGSTQTLTADTFNKINLNYVSHDTGQWNSTTKLFVAPINGYYDIACSLDGTTAPVVVDMILTVGINGASDTYRIVRNPIPASSIFIMKGSIRVMLNAGDTVEYYVYPNNADSIVVGGNYPNQQTSMDILLIFAT